MMWFNNQMWVDTITLVQQIQLSQGAPRTPMHWLAQLAHDQRCIRATKAK